MFRHGFSLSWNIDVVPQTCRVLSSDRLALSDAVEKLMSIRLPNTRAVERPDMTIVVNMQYNTTAAPLRTEKTRLVENRLEIFYGFSSIETIIFGTKYIENDALKGSLGVIQG